MKYILIINHFLANTNCTNEGLSSLNPKMPSYLFIEDQTSLNASQRTQVFCKGEKLLGGPVNSTFEDAILYLECNSTSKSWTLSESVWPKDENCIPSNKTCLSSSLPPTPGTQFLHQN